MSKTLDRLSKVLALADSGTTEGEREAALEKATEIAAAIGIDLAIARAHRAKKEEREQPEKRSYKVGDYRAKNNKWMATLFDCVAEPHDVRLTFGGNNIWVWGHGLPSDLDVVENLYSLAAIHMVSTADAALRRKEQGELDGRIWRANFYQGYVERLSSRLWETRAKAAKDAGGESTGVDLVLRSKAKEVDEFYAEETKHLSRRGTWSAPERYDWDGNGARDRGRHMATTLNLDPDSGIGSRKMDTLESGQ